MYLISLIELDGVRLLEGAEVRECELEDLAAFLAANEESRFGVLVDLRLPLFEGALGARVARCSGIRLVRDCKWSIGDLHLAQHC